MSFTKEKRAAIKKYMLEKIDEAAADPIKRTVDAFGIVPATAYRYMRELIADGLVDRGTGILMKLSNESAKNIKEIMDTYADVDNGLTRTGIPLKNIYPHYPVARSQARRLLLRFEDFKEVILDFDGIQEIGQAFAHEIFFVFRNKHPDVSIVPVNASADVQKMIDHVTSK